MRDAIARALIGVLDLLLPATGRHRAARVPEPSVPAAVVPGHPWGQPWVTPTKEEAAEIFRRRTAEEAGLVARRRRAAVLATQGFDYPYTFPGAPFPASAFRGSGAAA